MKNRNITIKHYLVFLISLILFLTESSIAQNSNIDSLVTKSNISLADISIELSEADYKTDIIINKIKKDSSLKKIKTENDSLIKGVKIDIKEFSDDLKNLDDRNNRRLGNTLVFWEQDLETVNIKIAEISNIISEVDEKINDFDTEQKSIVKTIEYLKSNNEAYSIQKKARDVKVKVDGIVKDLEIKKNYAVKILENLIDIKTLVTPIVDEVKDKIDQRRTTVTSREQKSLIEVNYSDSNKWDLSGIESIVKGEYNRLKIYLQENYILLIIHAILMALIIALFKYLHKNPINDITTKPTPYKRYFHKLLNSPISLGLSIGLLLLVGYYKTPPLVFIDIYSFLFIIPIFFLLKDSSNNKLLLYTYIFTTVMTIQTVYKFIPEETIYSRITLLFISILVAWGIIKLILYLRKNSISKNIIIDKIILFFTYLLSITVLIVLVSNIIGMVVFAEILLDSIFKSILSIILMSLLLIVSNGLLITFIESDRASKINSIRNNRPQIIDNTIKITNVIVFISLFHFISNAFGFEEIILETFYGIVNYQIGLGSITFSISGIFTFFFVIWLSLVVSRIIRNILEDDILLRMEVETGLLHTISMTVKYSIIAIGFFMAISAAGIPLNQMAIVFSAFGVGIGFGLQNIFNNLVSGFILLFERPIKIGDTVEVGTLIGQVKSIGIRSSKVRTFDGAEIIVPNGNLISNEVINWTLSDRKRRVEIIVGISYDSDPHVASDIFMNILKNHIEIVPDPDPVVYFRDLGESSLDFRLLFWTYKDWVKVRSDIVFEVFDALKEAGIEIPFPQQDLHLRSIDSDVEIKHKPEGNIEL